MIYCHHTSQVLLEEIHVLISLLVFLITYPKNSGRAVFLDFAKAFDKLSHKDLIYKSEKYGVIWNALKTI